MILLGCYFSTLGRVVVVVVVVVVVAVAPIRANTVLPRMTIDTALNHEG